MRKFLWAAALMVAAYGTAFAQDESGKTTETASQKYAVITNRFWDNWFVTVGGGASVFIGDHSYKMDFKDRIFGSANFSLGKWFTSGLGLRVGGDFDYVKKYASAGIHQDGTQVEQFLGRAYYKSKFKSWNFRGDALFNLSNMFCGYNPQRFWSFIPYASLGYMITRDAPKKNTPDIGLGVLNSFRLCQALDLNLDVRAKAFSDGYDGYVEGHDNDAVLTASLGLTVRLGKKVWSKYSPCDPNLKYTESEMNAIREKMNAMQRDNAALTRQLADQKPSVQTAVEKNTVVAPCFIVFDINKSVLRKDMRVSLKFFAETLKAQHANTTYTVYVMGYADNATGTAKRNKQLSEERAQAVYDCLTKEFGIPSSMLKTECKGGVNNMFFNDPALSRATVITAE